MTRSAAPDPQTALDAMLDRVVLRGLDELIQTELVDVEYCVLLREAIARNGNWTHPLPIDGHSGLVMDGNHRLQVARQLGLNKIPCIQFDYGDPGVEVFHWHSGQVFPKEKILGLAASRDLLQYKTTRHAFAVALPQVCIPLGLLR